MTDNLALWNSVERTDPDHTKPITGKSYSGNSPKPHYIVRRATEAFGPAGIGWGFTIEERFEDGAMIEPGFFERMHVAKVKVWFMWNGQRGEVEHIGGTMVSGKRANGKIYTDEDAPKKSVTDALIKALSMIGFAGDIFMGRYDDSRYVQNVRNEIAAEERQASLPASVTPIQPETKSTDLTRLISMGDEASSRGTETLMKWAKTLTKDEIAALGDERRAAWKREAAEIDRLSATDPALGAAA